MEVVELGTAPNVVRRMFDSAVLEVSPALAHRLWPSEIALRGRSVFPREDGRLDGRSPASLLVQCNGVVERLARAAGGTASALAPWTMLEPRGFTPDPLSVSDLAGMIENAQADAWIADADDGTFGFPEAACQVEPGVSGDSGKATLGLVFGREADDGDFYARASSDPAVFLAPRLLREGLDVLLIDRNGMRADPEAVMQLTLTRGNEKRTLDTSSRGNRSRIGDGGPASQALSVLGTLRPEAVLHLGPPKPNEGFAAPTLDVRIETHTDAGTRNIHFVLGDTALVRRQRLVFARVDGVDATFGIARDRLQPLLDAL